MQKPPSWNLGKMQRQLISGDDDLSKAVHLLKSHRSTKYREHIKFNQGEVILPGEEVYVGTLWCRWMNQVSDIDIAYKILAESMIPKEKSIKI